MYIHRYLYIYIDAYQHILLKIFLFQMMAAFRQGKSV
jgi:hypothetical protein